VDNGTEIKTEGCSESTESSCSKARLLVHTLMRCSGRDTVPEGSRQGRAVVEKSGERTKEALKKKMGILFRN
jgi:hypothetical protein